MAKKEKPDKSVSDYIMAMKRNALARLKRGEEPDVIMLYADDCAHCHSQFKLFFRGVNDGHGLGVPLSIVELTRQEVEKLHRKGKITKDAMDNKLGVIDKIIPVNKLSVIGIELKKESRKWASTTSNVDAVADLTPMWMHFRTHQIIGAGHRAGKNLKVLIDPEMNISREKTFKDTYSVVLGKPCTTVSCDPKAIVKINGKTYKKMG